MTALAEEFVSDYVRPSLHTSSNFDQNDLPTTQLSEDIINTVLDVQKAPWEEYETHETMHRE